MPCEPPDGHNVVIERREMLFLYNADQRHTHSLEFLHHLLRNHRTADNQVWIPRKHLLDVKVADAADVLDCRSLWRIGAELRPTHQQAVGSDGEHYLCYRW